MSRKVKPISRTEYLDKIQNEYRHDKKMDKEFKTRLSRALCCIGLFCFPCILLQKCKKDYTQDE